MDRPVVDFVPELAARGFDRVTIRHLLERMVLRFRVATEPGTQFRYESGDVGLLALVLSRGLAPVSVTACANERLWGPLGMEHDGVWSLDRVGGLEKAWCCLAGTARDLAKIGRLFLAGGAWNGEQVLSPSWVEASVQAGAFDAAAWPADFAGAGFRNYGYLWWLLSPDEGDYLAQGKVGQFLYLNPARNAIVVRLGRGGQPANEPVGVALSVLGARNGVIGMRRWPPPLVPAGSKARRLRCRTRAA